MTGNEIYQLIGGISGLIGISYLIFKMGKFTESMDRQFQEVRTDNREMKTEIKEMKTEIKEIKSDISKLNGKIEKLEGLFEERGKWEARLWEPRIIESSKTNTEK